MVQGLEQGFQIQFTMGAKEKPYTDFEIIRQVLAGHKDSYELLIRRYNQRLYRVAKSMLWEEEAIEDSMQEAYIKAYQQLSRFEMRSSFPTWITRILINECLMNQKRKHGSVSLDQEQLALQTARFTHHSTPEKMTMDRELKVLLEQAIGTLPEKYRMVFVMREIEHMSVSETGESLDITEGNVKARLSRAKEMLRDNLSAAIPVSELLDFNLVRCDKVVLNVLNRI